MPRSDSVACKIGAYVHRLQPRTLRGRLALTAIACSLVGVGATFGLVHNAASRQFAMLYEETASQHLTAFGAFVQIQREEVDLLATSLAETWEMHGGPGASGEGTTAPGWIDRAMTTGRCSGLVTTDQNGRTTFATGTPVETEALASVASRRPAGDPVSGLVWAGRALIVARRPLRDPTGRSLGYVVVARPLDSAVRSRFLPLDESVTITFTAPSAISVAAAGKTVPGFSRVRTTRIANGSSRTFAEIPGLTSPRGAGIDLVVHDTRLGSSMDAAREAAVGTGLLVILLGGCVGLVLASAVRRPIERTRVHLQQEGAKALEGLPCAPMDVRPETAREFVALAHEVDHLLSALRSRQIELVTASEQARRAESALRSALDDSPEAKLLVEDGRVVLANSAAESMFGIPASRLIGMMSTDLIEAAPAFDEDGERLTLEDARAMYSRPMIVRFADPSGADRWAEITTITHLEDAHRALVSARDITEERRLEALREEIFSLVSHDLRAPLTVVQGYLDILERPLQPEARQRALESARHNAGKMAGLLDDLLDAAAPEDLLTPKGVQPVPLCALAKDVATSMQATAPRHSIVVVCDEDVAAMGEERRLRQATVNLVSNAIKYAPESTTVTIRVLASGGRALLAVEDEGPGVPAEARETVFTRYGRLASADKKPGLGLGLYIVRIIAETHGGSVRVDEAPGGGARFVLELPLAGGERV